ncbi:monovalent cation:proton antiporter-2 (CPA2) family protein [Oleiagrimonas soli]|uniref:Glutathione-regulated potassium-efflux system protein KefB n=2 Tax=Oleiagrimonas soli TaxID=1543381 RepID=A0A841KMG9_9GAMM|nr:monovalent cation:proton antiporter-2 (CPA2) family protein [Oleiagrimonas soli]MBB6185087.1 glutathione-regulated potassium-efflux system protein KefB [Oleiagrimonas soli]
MHTEHMLQMAVVFLLATVLAVPLAKRFRLAAVLGFLLAGVVIGPHALGLVGDTGRVAQVSELGVVLMLFVIGLELSPSRLKVMRHAVFGTGLMQVLVCGVALLAVAYYGFGLPLRAAIVVGAALALSSTAFGLQILAERKEAGLAYGRQAFAVLLFQDLAAIPLIAAVPLLGTGSATEGPLWLGALRVIGTIAVVMVGGRYLLRPLFRIVARTRMQEVSTATALLVVMGTAWVMELAGASATLGAFLAGVLLADSEYRHELESHIEPFKGLLLGLFFISVGMSLDLSLIRQAPWIVACLVLGLLLVKGVLLWPIGRWSGQLGGADALRMAVLLSSGGEFAFVVLNLALGQHLLEPRQRDLLVLAVSLSMALMPLLVTGLARVLREREAPQKREYDHIDTDAPRVIIAGFGRVGQIVARVLRAQHIPFVALEASVDQVDLVRRFGGTSIFFGDPARPDLLRAAQADKAEVFVLATDDPQANLRTARVVKRQFPHLKIVARARNRQHAFRLMDLSIDEPVRETFYSSLKMTRHVLEALGASQDSAEAQVDRFREHDEALLKTQYLVYDDETALMQSSREALADLERIFEADSQRRGSGGGIEGENA